MTRGPAERAVPATAPTPSARSLRVASVRIRATGPSSLLARALGPLAAFEVEFEAPFKSGFEATDAAPAGPPPIEVVVEALAAPEVPAAEAVRTTRWIAPASPAEAPRIAASGIGVATLARAGPLVVRVREDLPRGDETAERLVIPALAERLRREDVHFVHAAALLPPGGPLPLRDPLPPGSIAAWLVPAARGGGKTTLSLSLRRVGWRLLSDDRGWLFLDRRGGSADTDVLVDPWPEAPRVGDRSLFLLPPDVAVGVRDPSTRKAPAPSLTPPRLKEPVRVAGVLVPRLVEGRGGDIGEVRGAAALAAFAPQSVLATEPATATASLRLVAALLARVPCLSVTVGDDPRALDALASRHALGTARSHLGSRSST